MIQSSEKPENIKKNNSSIQIFVFSLIGIGALLNIVLTIQLQNGHISLGLIFNALTLYFLASTMLLAVFMPYPPRTYGLHLNNWKSELLLGFLIGITGLLISAWTGKFLISTGFKISESISLDNHWTGLFSSHNLRFMLFYFFGAMLQETVSKGYFQSYLIGIFDERGLKRLPSKTISILISSLLFSLFHAAGGVYICLVTFVFSCLLGILYERNRSLIAITLIHFFCGVGAFLFSLYI